jgi:hypothetical protein
LQDISKHIQKLEDDYAADQYRPFSRFMDSARWCIQNNPEEFWHVKTIMETGQSTLVTDSLREKRMREERIRDWDMKFGGRGDLVVHDPRTLINTTIASP